MDMLLQDLRHALRGIRKSWSFTFVVVLTLALGIAANAAIFSIVDAVVLRPLPGSHPEQLVRLYGVKDQGATNTEPVSLAMCREYRESLRSLSGLAAYRSVTVQFAEEGELADRVSAAVVTGSFFEVLGLKAKYGRLLSSGDDGARGSNPVAVLGERFWKRRFDGRPDVVGAIVRINGEVFGVVGVAPAQLQEFERDPEVWLPMSMAIVAEPIFATQIDRMTNPFFQTLGRLADGVSLQQAQAEVDALSASLGAGKTIHLRESMEGEEVASAKGHSAKNQDWEELDWQKPWGKVLPASKNVSQDEKRLSWLLLAIVTTVLLIACANAAGLFLARAEQERKETAVRIALGASKWALFRRQLVDGLFLALLGAGSGLLLAVWAERLLLISAPPGLPLPVGMASSVLQPRVLAYTLVISVLAAVALSFFSAAGKPSSHLWQGLTSSAVNLGTAQGARSRLQSFLVTLQLMASVTLLIGAALLLRTTRNVAHVDLGFDAEHVLSASLDLSRQGYDKTRGAALLDPLLQNVQSIAGVDAAALRAGAQIGAKRLPTSANKGGPSCANLPVNMISPRYFSTLQIPLLRGRDFSGAESKDSAGVVIVNRAAAKLCWPNADPIGQHFSRLKTIAKPFEVVGIAGDVRDQELGQAPGAQIYVPLPQFYQAFPWQPSLSILVRTRMAPHRAVAPLLAALHRIDPKLTLYNVQTPREQLADAYGREQFLARLLFAFGALALVLSVAGLYGLLAYLTERSTRTFGIRMALGAQRHDIFQFVLIQGGRLALAGIGMGLLAAVATTRVLKSLLFGVAPTDAGTFAAVACLFLAVALLACYLPARRATRVDPIIALRDE